MFDLFFRPYVPGFRIRPRDDVPGFDFDETGLPRFDGMPPNSVTQQYSDATPTQTPPSVGFPMPASAGLAQLVPSISLASGLSMLLTGWCPLLEARSDGGLL